MPQGIREVSQNGRVFYSNDFIPRGHVDLWPAPKSTKRQRLFAIVTLLGDRRPYTLDVSVVEQRRESASHSFSNYKYHLGAASKLSEHFKKQLIKGREEFNIIDDFRVF